jgi:hypothetical protein
MADKFVVVVIDDKPDVCERIEKRVRRGPTPGQVDLNVPIEVSCVTVDTRRAEAAEKLGSAWTFAPSVFQQLLKAATSRPDLLIVDYVYVDRLLSQELKKLAREGSLDPASLKGRILTPEDLRKWVEGNVAAPADQRHKIIKNIFHARCPLYLHTHTPQGFSAVVGSVDERLGVARRVFPQSRISVIDTRRELFNEEEFDWPPDPDDGRRSEAAEDDQKRKRIMHDKKYYPFQLAVYFDQVTRKEVLRKALHRSRFLRVRRTTGAVAAITAIGAGVGFAAGWAGDLLYVWVGGQNYFEAGAMGLVLLAGLVAIGAACPFLFELLMRKLLPEDGEQDR